MKIENSEVIYTIDGLYNTDMINVVHYQIVLTLLLLTAQLLII